MSDYCKLLRFKTYTSGSRVVIEAKIATAEVGTIELGRDEVGMMVHYVFVESPRCGIGTKLYEQAQRYACGAGLHLASDTTRTHESEAFWAKQVSRGRAQCIDTTRKGLRLRFNRESGGYFEDVPKNEPGEWPCRQYRMRVACPGKYDLSRGLAHSRRR